MFGYFIAGFLFFVMVAYGIYAATEAYKVNRSDTVEGLNGRVNKLEQALAKTREDYATLLELVTGSLIDEGLDEEGRQRLSELYRESVSVKK